METDEIYKKLEQSKISTEREYIELCATIRHYSNLRFLIMPLYFTVNGAMFLGFQNDKLKAIPELWHNLWIIVVVLSTFTAWVFGVYRIQA
jgi:hypothetical protein